MVLTGLLIVTMAIPAHAVELDASSGLPQSEALTGPPQSLPVSVAATVAIQRDGYTVEEAPPEPVAAATSSLGSAIRWPFPTGVRISDGFGPRVAPCAGCSTFHKGLDMNPGEGTPVQVIADGVVREVSEFDNGGFGVHAIIDHTVDGQLVSSVYAHLQQGSLAVSPGQSVVVGQQLGNVGSTGQSTGPHLHLEILLDGVTPTDPFAWLTNRAGPQ